MPHTQKPYKGKRTGEATLSVKQQCEGSIPSFPTIK